MRYTMKVCFTWLFLAVFCLQGLSTAITDRNKSRQKRSRCFHKAHENSTTATATTTTTSAPLPCIASWTEFDGVLTTIAPHLAFEIRGIEDCKRACVQTIPGCVAIDVYPNVTFCIYHVGLISEVAVNRFTALRPGYKQLILNRVCPSGSVPKAGTDDLTIAAGNINESCTRQWTVTRDVHSPGYHTHLGVYGEAACKRDCIENITGCVGIELLRQFDSCNYFVQPVDELIKNRVPTEGNTQQILTKECHPTANDNNETDQQIQRPFNVNNFTYNATSSSSKLCVAKWIKVSDVFSLLHHRYPNIDGLDACQTACFETIPNCVAISVPEIDDIPLNRTECMYFIEPLSQVISSRMPLKGYSQYVLRRECLPDSINKEKAIEEFAQEDETIIKTNETSNEDCKWEEHKDVYSLGAKLYSKAVGIEACKTACLEMLAGCIAVDDHASGFCWYHKNGTNFDSKRQSNPGKRFIQYVRVCSTERE